MTVATESRREDDDVALIALYVFHVFDEHRHILAVLTAFALFGVGSTEKFVLFRTLLQVLLD
ncbi:hypothetical protein D3C76_1195200 [compost metagenome]